ncbi:MBL fold metallo-hydrolase [soil metagenome]
MADAPLVIGPGIAVIEQPMPGFAIPASNCYLIATGTGALVVDPGYGADGSAGRWAAGLAAVDRAVGDVESIILSHNHRDHAEGADALRELTGAPVLLHPDDADFAATRVVTEQDLEGWGVPAVRREAFLTRRIAPGVDPDGALAHGMELATSDGALRVVHTPGHTAGHVCFALERPRSLLTCDHVLPDLAPGACVGGWFRGNPLAVYLRSLDGLAAFEGWVGHPGHGAAMQDVRLRAREIAEHHGRRTEEVRALVAAHPGASAWALAERMRWRGCFASLDAGRMLSALRQTSWHVELAQDGGWP